MSIANWDAKSTEMSRGRDFISPLPNKCWKTLNPSTGRLSHSVVRCENHKTHGTRMKGVQNERNSQEEVQLFWSVLYRTRRDLIMFSGIPGTLRRIGNIFETQMFGNENKQAEFVKRRGRDDTCSDFSYAFDIYLMPVHLREANSVSRRKNGMKKPCSNLSDLHISYPQISLIRLYPTLSQSQSHPHFFTSPLLFIPSLLFYSSLTNFFSFSSKNESP